MGRFHLGANSSPFLHSEFELTYRNERPNFDVLLTSYDLTMHDSFAFKRHLWDALVSAHGAQNLLFLICGLYAILVVPSLDADC